MECIIYFTLEDSGIFLFILALLLSLSLNGVRETFILLMLFLDGTLTTA